VNVMEGKFVIPQVRLSVISAFFFTFIIYYSLLPTKVFHGYQVKLSLCLPKHHAMKAHWGSEGIAPRIL
jgi:hypothetical protein